MIATTQRTYAVPFVCEPGFYQVILGELRELNPDTGVYTPIGPTGGFTTNAMGYNTEDNYLYALLSGDLLRIEDDGAGGITVTNLGPPTNMVGTSVAGDFDLAGNLWVVSGGGNSLYSIDVSTNIATELPTSASISGLNDLVHIDGVLYGIQGGVANATLYSIDAGTGTVSTDPLTIDSTNSVFGAGFTTASDELFFAQNGNGVIYEVTGYLGATPDAQPSLQGQTTIGNDGAACALAGSVILPTIARDDTGSTDYNTTINVPAASGLLSNDQPDNVTVTSYTQPNNGSVVVNPDGSYEYIPDPGFSGTDTFTYTITDSVGGTATATVTITVRGPGESAEDSESLADTGTSTGQIATLGSLFIVLGVMIFLASKKKSYKV